ncbi:MAG: hypothetical protein CR994_02365 [Maribacter sp.]|nr:MAG: hypothetical protein CR994_02365 [Maribacter sp.]
MERILISFAMFFLTLGCSDKNDDQFQEEDFLGTWTLIEQREYGGTPNTDWRPVVNGYQIELKADGTFVTDKFSPECTEGEYSISITDNTLTFSFGCPGFSVEGLSDDNVFIEKYSFEGVYLILSPTYLSCDEGCAFKFSPVEG